MQAYIDFEIAEREFERTRQLYERLLDRTKHLKVWISYAKFEASAMEEVEQQEELPEDVLKEQRQQCIKNARSNHLILLLAIVLLFPFNDPDYMCYDSHIMLFYFVIRGI